MGGNTVYDVGTLRTGSHLHPRGGGCLLEIVSIVPEGRWGDHPRTVDPALAELARAVNDYTSDAARQLLVPYVPWLATGTFARGERTDGLVARLAGRVALGLADPWDAARLAPAMSRFATLEKSCAGSWWRAARYHQEAFRLIRSAVLTLSHCTRSDEALRQLLHDAVNATREVRHLPPLAAMPVLDGHTTLPVQAGVRVTTFPESVHIHCTALLDQWPAPLVQAWAAHASELANLVTPRPFHGTIAWSDNG